MRRAVIQSGTVGRACRVAAAVCLALIPAGGNARAQTLDLDGVRSAPAIPTANAATELVGALDEIGRAHV